MSGTDNPSMRLYHLIWRNTPVTGTSSGFGLHLTEAVISSGERVVATLRKLTSPQIQSLGERYSKEQLLVLPLDVTNKQQIDEAFDAVRMTFGRLDVVVNNAGYGIVGEVEATPEDEARKLMDVLFWGAVHISKKVSDTSFES